MYSTSELLDNTQDFQDYPLDLLDNIPILRD
jgi:hypothetical protein